MSALARWRQEVASLPLGPEALACTVHCIDVADAWQTLGDRLRSGCRQGIGWVRAFADCIVALEKEMNK